MSIVYYTKQDEFDLVNSGQDCIGWKVVDQAGGELGKVSEMLINVESEKVDSILIDGRKRIPAADFALKDGNVVVRGVTSGELHGETDHAAETENENYQPLTGGASKHVAGLTREGSDDELTIPIIEEQMQIGKRTVERGGAHVKTTMTEKPVEEKINLREENVTVERHKVDRPVDGAADAFKEGSFDVTTQAEVPVVSKEARVVEEVVINKEVGERTETIRDSVKRTDVEVDEIKTGDAANRR